MTAINDLVAAAAGIRVPFGILYESLPSAAARLSPVSAIGIAGLAGPDSPAEQSLPVDIYSLIEELRRSILDLNARAASVPDIYTFYLPSAAPAVAMPPAMPAPMPAPALEPSMVYVREQAEPADKKPGTTEISRSVPASPVRAVDSEIVRSSVALGKLREDYAGLTYDLVEVERLISEAMRSSGADIPAIASAKLSPTMSSPEPGVEYVERPAPEVIVWEKTTIVKEVETKEGARESGLSLDNTKDSKPAALATALAQGISLPAAIRKSTAEMMIMQTVLVPGPGVVVPVQAAFAPEPVQYPAAPAVLESRSAIMVEAVPDKISYKIPAPTAPVAQALDIARAFNALIGSYLSLRGTPARRGDIKDGVTQLLLSLPEQKSVEGPASGLLDVMAALQAPGPKAIEALKPVEIMAKPPNIETAELPQVNVLEQPTILGDLGELQGTMAALQDMVSGLQKAVPSSQVTPGIIEPRAAVWPEEEGMAGELSGIYASMAGLQAAMDYLRVNVPTLADFVVLQRAIVSIPGASPGAVPEAPVAVTIEGVQPKAAAPISLPDLSWVTREFGRMQGTIAQLQVPMYAEGGLVQEPTLAFVGESEPEWIVPQSTWNDSISKLNNSYSLLWSYIQDLGAAMDDTVGGVNEALKGIKSGGDDDSSDSTDIGSQINDTIKGVVDKYLGMVGLSVDALTNVEKTAGVGLLLGVGTVALPYAKNVMFGDDEDEEKEESSGGGDDKDEEEDDEEDFWDTIEDLDDAEEINDKRDGKFDPDEE